MRLSTPVPIDVARFAARVNCNHCIDLDIQVWLVNCSVKTITGFIKCVVANLRTTARL